MPNVQDRNSEFIGNLKQDYWTRRDTLIGQSMAIALHQNIYFLRAFYPFSVYRTAGLVADLSTNGLDLTPSGAGATISTLSSSLTPIASFNGTAQFSRASGAEWTHGGAFTEGGWVIPTQFTTSRGIIGKYRDDGANERSHLMYTTAAGLLAGVVSPDGSATTVITGPALSLNIPTHCIFRFIPSSELALFVNGRKVASVTVGVPAGFFTGGARAFVIGGFNNVPLYYVGSLGYMFYATAAVNDGAIFSLYEGSRAAFGV